MSEILKLPNAEQMQLQNNKTDASFYKVSEPTVCFVPTYDGENQPTHPSVVYFRQGWNGYKYWMAMTPYTSSDSQVENPSIVVSNDGVTWEVPTGLTNPLEPSPAGAAYNRDSELIYIKENNKLRLYWGNSLGEGWYLESSDGINWGTKVAVTGGPFGSSQADLIQKEDEWLAWTQPISQIVDVENENNNRLGLFKSDDGITWQGFKPIETNFNGNIWHTGVTRDASGYHFMISGHNFEGSSTLNKLYYGFSEDGENLIVDTTPLLTEKTGTFYDRQIYKSAIVPIDNETYRVYFSAQSLTNVWKIGYFDIKLNRPRKMLDGFLKPRLKVKERVLFKKHEIRDANYNYYGGSVKTIIPEFNQYENKLLMIRNTHDTPVKIRILTNMRGFFNWDTLYYKSSLADRVLQEFELGGTQQFYITKDEMNVLGQILPFNITIVAWAYDTVPTEGEISITMVSW